MAIKFETVRAGDLLYDCHMQPMGNTTMQQMGTWPVRIVTIDENGCMASWNGNAERFMSRRQVERLRRKPVKPKPNIFEQARVPQEDKAE